MGFINDLFIKHKFVRRTLVVWSVLLITWVVSVAFTNLDKLTAPVAAALGSVTAMLTVVIGFYQWSRGRDGDSEG